MKPLGHKNYGSIGHPQPAPTFENHQMCQSVTVDGQYTGEVQQLADLLGCHPTELVWREGDPMPEIVKSVGYKHCLCPIDLEATAKKFGYEHSCDNWNDSVFTSKDT